MIDIATQKEHANGSTPAILARLGDRSIVLIGMMGVGKSSIGRRLGSRLGVPFVDADTEIEQAAGMNIADIFARHGEAAFRSGEARVIARLLNGGPQVLATGGGAVMTFNISTAAAIVATPTAVTVAMRIPASMKGALSGSSTCVRSSLPVIPIPIAASLTAGSMLMIPV